MPCFELRSKHHPNKTLKHRFVLLEDRSAPLFKVEHYKSIRMRRNSIKSHNLTVCLIRISMKFKEDNINRYENSHIQESNSCLCIIQSQYECPWDYRTTTSGGQSTILKPIIQFFRVYLAKDFNGRYYFSKN